MRENVERTPLFLINMELLEGQGKINEGNTWKECDRTYVGVL